MTKPTHPSSDDGTLNAHLYHHAKVSDDLRHLIMAIGKAAKYIQFAIRTTDVGLAGTHNQFGEAQLKLDIASDEIIQQHLRESALVASMASEEHPDVISVDPKAPFSVVYDPLDGSSLFDVNFAIGSIFGIYEGAEILGRKPREQVAALYVIYGPRTLLVYSTGDKAHMFVLNDVGEFVLFKENISIEDKATTMSPGNIGALKTNPGYQKAMQRWIDNGYTLRYSGCMVSDVHHVISKGQGVFTNLGDVKRPLGKLRLAFECGPFAYIVEHAGGASSDGSMSLLDKLIENVDQRTPIIIGSKSEVQAVLADIA
jgi:fructose-1,6-bisphosphatase I